MIKEYIINKETRGILLKGNIITPKEDVLDFKKFNVIRNIHKIKREIRKDLSTILVNMDNCFFGLDEENDYDLIKQKKKEFITIHSASRLSSIYLYSLKEGINFKFKKLNYMKNLVNDIIDENLDIEEIQIDVKKDIENINKLILKKSFNNRFLNKILNNRVENDVIDKSKFEEILFKEISKYIDYLFKIESLIKRANLVDCEECGFIMEYLDNRFSYHCSNEDCFHEIY